MPRELLKIGQFDKGMQLNVDPSDASPDSLHYMEDVDPITIPGMLQGRKAHEEFLSPLVLQQGITIQNENGTEDLIYYVDGTICVVEDIHNSPNTDIVTPLYIFASTPASVTFSRINKEVFVGTGSGPVLWIGKIGFNRFGTTPTTIYKAVELELITPGLIPYFSKMVVDRDQSGAPVNPEVYTMYGIKKNDIRIYKIIVTQTVDATSAVVTKSADGLFLSVQSICRADAGYLWLLDDVGGNASKVYKIDTSDLTVTQTHEIASYSDLDTNAKISDIESTDTHLWFGAICNGGNITTEGFLYNASLPTGNDAITPTNKSPHLELKTGLASVGKWAHQVRGAATPLGVAENAIVHTPLYPLVVIDTTGYRIGYAAQFLDIVTTAVTEWPVYFGRHVGPYGRFCTAGILIVSASQSKGADFQLVILENTNFGEQRWNVERILCNYDIAIGSLFYADGSTMVKGHSDTNFLDATFGTWHTTMGSEVYSEPYTNEIIVFDRDLVGNPAETYFGTLGGAPTISSIETTAWVFRDEGVLYPIYKESGISLSIEMGSEDPAIQTDFYKYSFIANDIMETPLSDTTLIKSNDGSARTITVTIADTSIVPVIFTAINIYHASSEDEAGTGPEGYYRLVKTITLKDNSFSVSGDGRAYVFVDTSLGGVSYETNTGIPESIAYVSLKYALSCTCGSELFITRVTHPSLPDAQTMVFKSKPFRFGMFNWVEEYLKLPCVPVAMKSWNGRVYIFGETDCYIVNPQSMNVEQKIPGLGTLGQNSVGETPLGLVVANAQSVWLLGEKLTEIGRPILETMVPDILYWNDLSFANMKPWVIYSTKYNAVFIIVEDTDTYAFVFFFSVGQWSLWSIGDYNTKCGGFSNKEGEVCWSDGVDLFTLGTGAARVVWTAYTQYLDFDSPQQKKILYGAVCEKDNTTVALTYSKDRAFNTFASLTVPQTAKGFMFKLVGAVNGTVSSLEILFRKMIGVR